MAIGLADPETAALIGLAELAEAAESAVERWEREVDLSDAELRVELWSRHESVRVVQRALGAVDAHWRLANAILDERFQNDPTRLDFQQLIDTAPGLSMLEAERGSLWAWMRGEFRKQPVATLAALVAVATYLGDKFELFVDRPEGGTYVMIEVPHVSDDTREIIAQRIVLPDGTSVTIEVRSISDDASVPIARIRPSKHLPVPPRRQLPDEKPLWSTITLPEPLDTPLPEGPFYIVLLPTGSGLPHVLEVDEGAAEAVHRLIWQVEAGLAEIRPESSPSGVEVVSIRTRTEADSQTLETWLEERGARRTGPTLSSVERVRRALLK